MDDGGQTIHRADMRISTREYVDLAVKNLGRQLEAANVTNREAVEQSQRRSMDALTAIETQIKLSLAAHNESHAREHQLAEMAIQKADEQLTIRLGHMNEFRAQITAERGSFLTKAEFKQFEDSLTSRIGRMQDAIEKDVSRLDEKWDVRAHGIERNIAENTAWRTTVQGRGDVVRLIPVLIGTLLSLVALWAAFGR